MSMKFKFPGGKLDTIRIPATAGNVVTNISPDAKRFIVLRGNMDVTNGIGVANRLLNFSITDGVNVVETLYNSAVIAGSGTRYMSFGEGRIVVGGTFVGVGEEYLGILPILLECPQEFRITLVNGFAADSYNGRIQVREVDV